MQLINNSVFDQKSQQRAKEIAETVERKSQLRDLRETMRLQKHFQRVFSQNVLDPTHSNKAAQTYEINVDGIKFRVVDRGSKLIRIAGINYPLCSREHHDLIEVQTTRTNQNRRRREPR